MDKISSVNIIYSSTRDYKETLQRCEKVLEDCKVKTTYCMVESTKGHDSFLLEPELFKEIIKDFI